jgi:sulfite exporter TauE/SafE
LDQLSIINSLENYLPWVSFGLGIGGSLHCVGMCGGLVAASCSKKEEVVQYQLGRLLGYLILGVTGGFLGSLIKFQEHSKILALVSSLSLSLVFIMSGFLALRKKSTENKFQKFQASLYRRFWRLLPQNRGGARSFMVGGISILLPCGLLYAALASAIALGDWKLGMISIIFFWLGTLPGMVLAPQLVKRVLLPLKLKLPKLYGVSFIVLGILTLTVRVSHVNSATSVKNSPVEHHSCH